jgi:hypothetical protein
MPEVQDKIVPHGIDALSYVVSGFDEVEESFEDDSAENPYLISGPEKWTKFVGAAARKPAKRLLRDMAKVRPSANMARVDSRQAALISRLGQISRQVLVQTGRLEADYLRRPNTLCSVYTPVIAPGATSAFQVIPGSGNSYYRLLGFIAHDDQCNVFGFTQLKVGGQDHVSFTQSTPTAPVSNAVPWAIFQYKEGKMVVNLAPWTGQVFDQSSPIIGTIANMTVAGAGDAVTIAARGVFLAQTDPCGYRYTQMTEQSKMFWKSFNRNTQAAYDPLSIR